MEFQWNPRDKVLQRIAPFSEEVACVPRNYEASYWEVLHGY